MRREMFMSVSFGKISKSETENVGVDGACRPPLLRRAPSDRRNGMGYSDWP
jgi:hypothetical protein